MCRTFFKMTVLFFYIDGTLHGVYSEWVPGASFQRKAREWRQAVMDMKEAPFETAIKNFVRYLFS